MRNAKHKRGSAAVLVAACILVLQAFLSAWAFAAAPDRPVLDAYGNPLCITSGVHENTTPPGDHSKLGGCCTFSCSASASLLTALPGGTPGLHSPLPAAPALRRYGDRIERHKPDHDPGSPRAPPILA